MRVIADLHIHSRYSRATSEEMCPEKIARFAQTKGLTIIGTGDFTHPKWLDELKRTLVLDPDTRLYKLAAQTVPSVHFMMTTEISTVFNCKDQPKKVHHVVLAPTLDTAEQINDRLTRYGDLQIDGRPTLRTDPPTLLEEIMEVSDDNMVFPAHAWTPWFSVFGAFSGFDDIEECYQDMTKHVHAIETGLSSDPPMNWRLSQLDRFALVSNSDSHSFWPWRIGREANVFELPRPDYGDVVEAIRMKDKQRFKFTIETDPAYGKYHWTGHRHCQVALSPREATKLADICPVCRKRLTKGVEQRVEELADRPDDFKPANAIDYVRLLPLSEIIATLLGADSPSTQKVWNIYNSLIGKLGNEYAVLLDASKEDLVSVAGGELAEAVIRVREGKIEVIPGYDGVYGQLILTKPGSDKKAILRRVQQLNLTDFTF